MQDWPVCIYPNHSNACFLEQISGGYYDVTKLRQQFTSNHNKSCPSSKLLSNKSFVSDIKELLNIGKISKF